MIVGLGKAAELVTKNLEKYSCHMKEIRDYLEEKLIVFRIYFVFFIFKVL
jgi:cysteine sulfinate desulfinase/cysteine desulfurase-like protein